MTYERKIDAHRGQLFESQRINPKEFIEEYFGIKLD